MSGISRAHASREKNSAATAVYGFYFLTFTVISENKDIVYF